MAESVSFSNSYIAYWENDPMLYPPKAPQDRTNVTEISTGWHVLPTMLWEHFITNRQWYEMVMHYEAYHVEGFKITLFNPIPVTEQIAIQQTTTFTAFNNTVYSWGASDELYETSWHNWYLPSANQGTTGSWWEFNLAYKEGYNYTSQKRIMFPKYTWTYPMLHPSGDHTWSWNTEAYIMNSDTTFPSIGRENDIPTGVFWDPLNEPSRLMELRPGKNAMSFAWKCHDVDEGRWFNFDLLTSYWPYRAEHPFTDQLGGFATTDKIDPRYQHPWPQTSYTTQGTHAFDMPDYRHLPIVPIYWFWKEMQNSFSQSADNIAKQPDLYACGTEYAAYKYPPTQHFVKGVPILNENGTLIHTSTQGSVTVQLNLQCKKRRSKVHAPTWGPMSWNMTHTIDGPFTLPVIRYRTGGATRPWTTIKEQPSGTMPQGPYTTGSYPNLTSTATYTQARSKPAYKES